MTARSTVRTTWHWHWDQEQQGWQPPEEVRKVTNFKPEFEELPPLEELIETLKINENVVQEVITEFVQNPPVPELANLPLAK